MIRQIKKILKGMIGRVTYPLDQKMDKILMLQGQISARQNKNLLHNEIFLEDVEFSVFSQNGEDGIIDYLIELLELDTSNHHRTFIEFGVENYTESNTRYLLKNRNWQGCIIDGSQENIDHIRNDSIYWKHDLEAICSFITKNNIDSLIQNWLSSRNIKDVTLLSIDVDGVDYYIWENIQCIQPILVVIEFNALFGSQEQISVPYRDDFQRHKAHYSGLFFGASIKALTELGKTKGYHFLGADKSGTNLFFVLDEYAQFCQNIKVKSYQSYCDSHLARQSRSGGGGTNLFTLISKIRCDSKLQFCQSWAHK